MRLLPFTAELGARHAGNRGWLGTNPKIEIVKSGEKFDYVWVCAWGDGDAIFEDMEKARRIGRCIFNITGDQCYVPLAGDGNYYFCTNLNDKSEGLQTQVPYSYHASLDWHTLNITKTYDRKFLANFQGSFSTNPKRQRLYDLASERVIIKDCDGWQAAQAGRWDVIREHDELLAQSYFTLCPRGIGKSSIRVVEAIFRGSLPVLLDDSGCLFGDDMAFCLRYPLGGDMSELRGILEDLEGTPAYYDRIDEMRAFKNRFLLRDYRDGCTGTTGYTNFIKDNVT